MFHYIWKVTPEYSKQVTDPSNLMCWNQPSLDPFDLCPVGSQVCHLIKALQHYVRENLLLKKGVCVIGLMAKYENKWLFHGYTPLALEHCSSWGFSKWSSNGYTHNFVMWTLPKVEHLQVTECKCLHSQSLHELFPKTDRPSNFSEVCHLFSLISFHKHPSPAT